jgi:uncharacterized caspase-like protein
VRSTFLRVLAGAVLLQAAVAAASERQLQIAPAKPAPHGEKRLALIIGNAAYKTAPLRNPVNDARAIAKALASSGFRVTVLEDATQATMFRAIRRFGDDLQSGGVGLFYYAGHGMQVRGKNYLLPVNADMEREDEVEFQAIDANVVLSKMDSAKNSLNIMVLDACRNNPFARSFRSSAQGLAQMEAPSGTLIAFATAPGSVAADGDGSNGLYTKHLLDHIGRPGLPVEQLFKQVRIGVTKETSDRQVPWESSSLKGDFFFIAPDASQQTEAQRQDTERRIASAVKDEREKLAAERAAMERVIREMLAKQRAELEQEIRRAGGKIPVAAPAAPATPATPAAAAPAPVQTASAAPTALAGFNDSRYPTIGDYWEYTYKDTMTRATRPMRFEVVGVSKEGILDKTESKGIPLTRVYSDGPDLFFTDGGDTWHFAPYLLAFQPDVASQRWGKLYPLNDSVCRTLFSCLYEGKVAGRERVATPAGTFEATKVVIDFQAGSPSGSRAPILRQATFWYSETAKRVVKSTLRTLSGGGFVTQPDYDLELQSYQVNVAP